MQAIVLMMNIRNCSSPQPSGVIIIPNDDVSEDEIKQICEAASKKARIQSEPVLNSSHVLRSVEEALVGKARVVRHDVITIETEQFK
jgi:hypothetical protein